MDIRILPKLTPQHFYEMEALELQFYDAEFITPPEESWRWYKKYPNTTIAAEAENRIVGFVNLFPVRPDIYAELKAGRFNDHFMELDDVADTSSLPLHMFLCCVVIDKDYQRRGIAHQLLHAAAMPYVGLPCIGIITDNVTTDGQKLSERYGFSFICNSDHDSRIYEQDWESFIKLLAE